MNKTYKRSGILPYVLSGVLSIFGGCASAPDSSAQQIVEHKYVPPKQYKPVRIAEKYIAGAEQEAKDVLYIAQAEQEVKDVLKDGKLTKAGLDKLVESYQILQASEKNIDALPDDKLKQRATKLYDIIQKVISKGFEEGLTIHGYLGFEIKQGGITTSHNYGGSNGLEVPNGPSHFTLEELIGIYKESTPKFEPWIVVKKDAKGRVEEICTASLETIMATGTKVSPQRFKEVLDKAGHFGDEQSPFSDYLTKEEYERIVEKFLIRNPYFKGVFNPDAVIELDPEIIKAVNELPGIQPADQPKDPSRPAEPAHQHK